MGNPALNEFRELFTAKLMENDLPGIDPSYIRDAVEKATEGWSAKYDFDLVRGADGKTVDSRHDLHSQVIEPATPLVRITATGAFRRDKSNAEINATKDRVAAMIWGPGDGPPPAGVGTVRLLDQDVWWKPREEPALTLKAMKPSHRAHLLAFLRRNAVRYKRFYEGAFIGGPMPSGNAASDAVDSAMDELFYQKPEEWIEKQPLVKRLRRMVAKDERKATPAAEVSG